MAALALAPSTLRQQLEEIELIVETLEALESDDCNREELTAYLAQQVTGTKEKIDRTARTLSTLEAAAEAAGLEAKRLNDRRARFCRQYDRLANYLLATMSAAGVKTLNGCTSTLTVKLNPPAVMIDCEADLPAEYLRYPVVPAPVPDKATIKTALANGVEVKGARLIQLERLCRS